ncbi:MAG: hypothetical protein A3J07_03500 [Candidatus Doudnabacteria bacterium RIFCSPLOWO2_02_FULL_49_13]|nr:MAG: hypothetical protein A3J07_03500 [Candidatus Doudnabacteria bacterium RIFCSPLOWO2_02_FULL_49_13]
MTNKVISTILILTAVGLYGWFQIPIVKVTEGYWPNNYTSRKTMNDYLKWKAEQRVQKQNCLNQSCPLPL